VVQQGVTTDAVAVTEADVAALVPTKLTRVEPVPAPAPAPTATPSA
jgi:hypothetical protein